MGDRASGAAFLESAAWAGLHFITHVSSMYILGNINYDKHQQFGLSPLIKVLWIEF